jgi:hypothetical protein
MTLSHRVFHWVCRGQWAGRCSIGLRAGAAKRAGTLTRSRRRLALGASPWDDLTDAHPAVWRKQITRTRRTPLLNEENYVDEHALSQIVAFLPALGADASETVMVRVVTPSAS